MYVSQQSEIPNIKFYAIQFMFQAHTASGMKWVYKFKVLTNLHYFTIKTHYPSLYRENDVGNNIIVIPK